MQKSIGRLINGIQLSVDLFREIYNRFEQRKNWSKLKRVEDRSDKEYKLPDSDEGKKT